MGLTIDAIAPRVKFGVRSITAWMRWVFQAMTMFASKVRAPEMAPSCSVVRPCFAVIIPLWMAR